MFELFSQFEWTPGLTVSICALVFTAVNVGLAIANYRRSHRPQIKCKIAPAIEFSELRPLPDAYLNLMIKSYGADVWDMKVFLQIDASDNKRIPLQDRSIYRLEFVPKTIGMFVCPASLKKEVPNPLKKGEGIIMEVSGIDYTLVFPRLKIEKFDLRACRIKDLSVIIFSGNTPIKILRGYSIYNQICRFANRAFAHAETWEGSDSKDLNNRSNSPRPAVIRIPGKEQLKKKIGPWNYEGYFSATPITRKSCLIKPKKWEAPQK